ncbi:MAG TPA: T9SS type A sorting domain-containing protein [Flavobacterium lutivivi]|nr:T9SS type A sorting domain-containing protein [Flavobacterium lutivivi]
MKKGLLFLFFIFSSNLFAQFYEDFENTTGPDVLPSNNWTLASGNWLTFSTGSGTTRWDVSNEACDGNGDAFTPFENIGIGNTSKKYLITPPLFLDQLNPIIKFNVKLINPNNDNTTLKIHLIHENFDPTDANNYSLVFFANQSNFVNPVCEELTIALTGFTSDYGFRVVFEVENTQTTVNTNQAVWHIDNVANHDIDSDGYLNFIPFVDLNNNNIKEENEPLFKKGSIVYEVNNSGVNQNLYSNFGYYLYTNSSETYDISYNINSLYNNSFVCTTSFNDISNSGGNNDIYIPILYVNPLNDVEIVFIPVNNPIPGSLTLYNVIYTNNSNQNIPNGTINFIKDSNQSFDAIPFGAITNSNGFSYSFTNLGAFETRSFIVSLQNPPIPIITIGQILTNSVSIDIPIDDILSNNISSISQTVVASYDPNDKTEAHGGKIVFSDFNSSDYLTYTIRFENTGNANAQTIRIEDVMDSQLDENTFELVSASHEVTARKNGSQFAFIFNNIDLPPSIPDSEIGHGFVTFKIKPKPGFVVGDIIPNTAEIYFDSNPPIITNTFNTEFVQSLSNVGFNQNNVTMYPNPANDNLLISNMGTEKISEIVIYEISGKKVFDYKKSFESQVNINVSNFARGIYLVEIISENKSKLTKKLILK